MNILTIDRFRPAYKDRLGLRGVRVIPGAGITALIDGREHDITEKHLLLAQGCVPLAGNAGRRITYAVPTAGFENWEPRADDHATDDPRIIAAAILAEKMPPTPDGEWLAPLPADKAVEICEAFRARCIAGFHDSTLGPAKY